jgi:hypothetical protein
MPRVDIEITREEIDFKPGTMTRAAEVALRHLNSQAEAGISETGDPLPGNVDLHASGELFGSAQPGETEQPAGREGHIDFPARHAPYIFKSAGGRYAAEDVAPQNRRAFEAEVEPILEAGAILIERKG